jgi:hypothetical protein
MASLLTEEEFDGEISKALLEIKCEKQDPSNAHMRHEPR